MLSFLLEKFIRRLCGRWLRDFSAENLSISLGGSIEFTDVWLDTSELSKMLLPFEPVMAHAMRLRLELPISLTGTLLLYVDDVDLLLRSQDYDVDPEAARRAVEIAVNLYWANYMRPPAPAKGGDDIGALADAGALADTIAALLRSARVVVRRLHVRVESALPRAALGDGAGEQCAAGLVVARMDVGDVEDEGEAPADSPKPEGPETHVSKTCAFVGVAIYCGPNRNPAPDVPIANGTNVAEERAARLKALAAVRRGWAKDSTSAAEFDVEGVTKTTAPVSATSVSSYFGSNAKAVEAKRLRAADAQAKLRAAALGAANRAAGGGDVVVSALRLAITGRFTLELHTAILEQTPLISTDCRLADRRPPRQRAAAARTRPWIRDCAVTIEASRFDVTLNPSLCGFALDACDRLSHAHRRRQDSARRSFRQESLQPRASFDIDESEDCNSEDCNDGGNAWAATMGRDADAKRRGKLVARELWACCAGAVHCDIASLARTRPLRQETSAGKWRRWFQEWRSAAKYVAVRKLLQRHVRCGVFRDDASGEAYYELGESSCVTRRGKFYVHPVELSEDEVDKAWGVVLDAVRPATYQFKPQESSQDAALSSWREMTRSRKQRRSQGEPSSPEAASRPPRSGLFSSMAAPDGEAASTVTEPRAMEPRLALALYATQLRMDAVLPASKAAALRAIAARHVACRKAAVVERKAKAAKGGATVLVAPLGISGLPSSSSWIGKAGGRDVRVDVAILAAHDDPRPARSAAANVDGSCATWRHSTWREVSAPAHGGVCEFRVVDVSVEGAYERVLGVALRDVDDLVASSSKTGSSKVFAFELDLHLEEPTAHDYFNYSAPAAAKTGQRLRLAVAVAAAEADLTRARKSLDYFLDQSEASPQGKKGPIQQEEAATKAVLAFALDDVKLAMEAVDGKGAAKTVVKVEAERLEACSSTIRVRGAEAHAPGATGEGCVFASLARLWSAALAQPSGAGNVWSATGCRVESDFVGAPTSPTASLVATRLAANDPVVSGGGWKTAVVAPNGTIFKAIFKLPAHPNGAMDYANGKTLTPPQRLASRASAAAMPALGSDALGGVYSLGSRLALEVKRCEPCAQLGFVAPLYAIRVRDVGAHASADASRRDVVFNVPGFLPLAERPRADSMTTRQAADVRARAAPLPPTPAQKAAEPVSRQRAPQAPSPPETPLAPPQAPTPTPSPPIAPVAPPAPVVVPARVGVPEPAPKPAPAPAPEPATKRAKVADHKPVDATCKFACAIL
ncbi:hypothetical protein M885DRAFT_510549 [Pelagophyceae sp. CCMP2097]|nr:hypothetical protein M885DRAFT_510549 [Pelagophyceae sp. CCMP2097]|mmetsp:Transcript_13665/g.45574  ORF Transcript_13665/g.45574 Transcript_13665/m.45574 type:complete len:1260 (-) Transcript_13665:217-3996(-)